MKHFNTENIIRVANNDEYLEIDASNKFYDMEGKILNKQTNLLYNNVNADGDPNTLRKKLVDCINLKYTLK
jgi:hypothetical protein